MPERFYQNYNEDLLLSLYSKVIVKREFAALTDIEEMCSFLPQHYLEMNEHVFPDNCRVTLSGIMIPLFYIYYVMLDDKEKEIFKSLKKVVTTYSLFVSNLYAQQDLEQTIKDNDNVNETPYLDLAKKILYYYKGIDNQNDLMLNQENQDILWNNYTNGYQQIRDDVYILILIGFGHEKFLNKIMPPYVKDIISTLLYDACISIISGPKEEDMCVETDFSILNSNYQNDIDSIRFE